MQITESFSGSNQVWYRYRMRLALFKRNVIEFIMRLLGHPTALLGAVMVLVCLLVAILASWLAPHSPTQGNYQLRLIPPVWESGGNPKYLLGTDLVGRDILSRIIFGARVAFQISALTVSISATLGILLGCLAGYYRGRLDQILSRFVELEQAFPLLLLAITILAVTGAGFVNLIFALTVKSWVPYFRVARGEVMAEAEKEYVMAAKVIGQGKFRILLSEILPNILHSLLVLATLQTGTVILSEASLSFLGLGIQPPTPAWGYMVADGRDYVTTAWWVSTLPGIAIMILVLSLNLFGEGIRDLLDPRLRIE
ncbi:MAG: ABC transporter permease [Anaerolineales bacterium]|nr:ABC transporter permease [Anaerolineales bacterium]